MLLETTKNSLALVPPVEKRSLPRNFFRILLCGIDNTVGYI
jgi:hypothetical protein